jgi:hypothetical protein
VTADAFASLASLPAGPGASRPVRLDDNVQFTVYRPKAVEAEKWHALLAFAHLADKPPDAPSDEPDPLEEVRRQAEQALGAAARDYASATQDSAAAIPAEGEITFVPEIPGVAFNPPRRTFLWEEAVHKEEFRMRASAALVGQVARGRLSAYLGAILVAEVNLAIRVEARVASRRESAPREAERARVYRKIFASYSHRDLEVVRQFETHARALGDEYLRDWVHLRTGEVWTERLKEMIEEADVFQLFWSHNSMRSRFVRQEWEHALSLGRRSFVRPTYWERPMPELLEENLPPEALRQLHFHFVGAGADTDPAPPPLPTSAAIAQSMPLAAADGALGSASIESEIVETMSPQRSLESTGSRMLVGPKRSLGPALWLVLLLVAVAGAVVVALILR